MYNNFVILSKFSSVTCAFIGVSREDQTFSLYFMDFQLLDFLFIAL